VVFHAGIVNRDEALQANAAEDHFLSGSVAGGTSLWVAFRTWLLKFILYSLCAA